MQFNSNSTISICCGIVQQIRDKSNKWNFSYIILTCAENIMQLMQIGLRMYFDILNFM